MAARPRPKLYTARGSPGAGAVDAPLSAIKSNGGKTRFFRTWEDEAPVFYGIRGQVPIYMNPDPVLAEFGRDAGLGIYDAVLDKNPHVGGLFDVRRNALLSLDWDIVAWSNDAEHVAHADTVRRVIEAIPNFYDSELQMLSGIFKGYSISEINWSPARPGFIDSIVDRDPRDFVFDLAWKPRVLTDRQSFATSAVPDWKLIVMRYRATDWNPYGSGLGKGIYWFDHFKRAGVRYWVEYCQRFATPLADASYKSGSGLSDEEVLAQLDSLQTGTAIAHTDDVVIQFLKGGGEGGNFDMFLTYLDYQCSKRLVGQTLSSDAQATGLGSGVAKLQSEVRQDILDSDARALECTLNYQLIVPIVGFNHGWRPDGDYPRFVIRTAPPRDLAVLLDEYERLVKLGVDIGVDHVRNTFQVPEPEIDEAVLSAPAPPPNPFGAQPVPPNGGPPPMPNQGKGGPAFGARPDTKSRDSRDTSELTALEVQAAQVIGLKAAALQRQIVESLRGKAQGRR